MKLIIDIPDNTYADIQEHKRYTDFTILDLIKAIRHSTPIPDNATNGDVLEMIFPDGVKTSIAYPRDVSKDWHNAPYQKGGK